MKGFPAGAYARSPMRSLALARAMESQRLDLTSVVLAPGNKGAKGASGMGGRGTAGGRSSGPLSPEELSELGQAAAQASLAAVEKARDAESGELDNDALRAVLELAPRESGTAEPVVKLGSNASGMAGRRVADGDDDGDIDGGGDDFDRSRSSARGRVGGKAGTEGGALRLHVLLVDDERSALKFAKRHLQTLGCTVTTCTDGDQVEAALDAAARPFDCIVMDILMQRIGGIEACQLLREKRGVRIPIIAATVDVGAKAEAMYYGAGFDVVLGKPYTKELMKTKLLEA